MNSTTRQLLFVSSTTDGGSGRSQRHLVRDLITRGHGVHLIADDGRPNRIGRVLAERLADATVHFEQSRLLRRLESIPGRQPTPNMIDGVDVLTSIAPHNPIPRLLRDDRPDVVIASSIDRYTWRRIREHCADASVPTLLYIREASALGHLTVGPHHDALLANAQSLTDDVEALGHPCVFIPSAIDTAPTRTDSTRRTALLINPIASHGVERLWELAAALPHVPFVIQESWPLDKEQRAVVDRQLPLHPNVDFRSRQPPGPALYGDARVLLVPHRIDNRPRVIVEAHANGIPALVADHGGLREVVGSGGVVLPDDTAAWVDAVAETFRSESRYAQLCDAARKESTRAEVDPVRVTDRFETAIGEIIESSGNPRR